MTLDKYSVKVDKFKPNNLMGFIYLFICISMTLVGGWLSISHLFWVWLTGQFVLAFALLMWFILLHEAGHKTLFKNKILNTVIGHLSGFISGFPYISWQQIHFRHHKWTGWQDLDATTASLVPRELNRFEKGVINICWRIWIPLFALLYRINNYWNYPRIKKFVARAHHGWIAWNIIIFVILYGMIFYIFGLFLILKFLGLAIILSLIYQEILILSQHTHIPYKISDGKRVSAFIPLDQEVFTRSLVFPKWFSRYFLMNFDAHELHHMYIKVPGYYLGRIDYKTKHSVNAWTWIKESKRMSGVKFLFQNRSITGFDL